MSLPLAEEETGLAPGLPLELADDRESIKITGFWMFLVTDVLIFASLFASYAVYRSRVALAPGPAQVFHYGPVLLETLLLLTSSFTVGLAIWAMRTGRTRMLFFWLAATLVLGAGFVTSEIHDFTSMVGQGLTWHQSAFLSAFYVLVGTHGAHVTFGIVWAVTLLFQVARRGITPVTARKLYTFSLYWHFLDIVWVFIFTFVYLGGKIG
jgi:heme/copper-type cytochrome/quinol oxidase subunit 3